MTKTHTPGPWKIHGGPDYPSIVAENRENDGQLRDVVIANVDGGFNARLIASAPDLLAALKGLEMRISTLRAVEQGGVDRMPVPAFLAAARAAIQKAEGKE